MTVDLDLAVPVAEPAVAGGAPHLTADRWAKANRHLLRKALAEFAHERILVPEIFDAGTDHAAGTGKAAAPASYRVVSDHGTHEYQFEARVLDLDHWSIDARSIRCLQNGQDAPLDVLEFITAFHGTLGINIQMLPVYLEEVSSTLASHAYKQWAGQPSADALAAGVTGGLDPAADFQAIERSMT